MALQEMVDRLIEDHQDDQSLAYGLIELGMGVDLGQVQRDIIHVELVSLSREAEAFCKRLAARWAIQANRQEGGPHGQT